MTRKPLSWRRALLFLTALWSLIPAASLALAEDPAPDELLPPQTGIAVEDFADVFSRVKLSEPTTEKSSPSDWTRSTPPPRPTRPRPCCRNRSTSSSRTSSP